MKIRSEDSDFHIDLKQDDMLIPGKIVGDIIGNNSCYLPFFVQHAYPETWILGNVILKSYYLVYDMTHWHFWKFQNFWQEYKSPYNRIGVGLKNPIDLIGKNMLEDEYNEQSGFGTFLMVLLITIMIGSYCLRDYTN